MKQTDKTPSAPQASQGSSHSVLSAVGELTTHLALHAGGAYIGGAIAGPAGAVAGSLIAGLSHTGTLEAPGIPYQPPAPPKK